MAFGVLSASARPLEVIEHTHQPAREYFRPFAAESSRRMSRDAAPRLRYFISIETRMRSAVRSTPSLLLMIEQVLATVL